MDTTPVEEVTSPEDRLATAFERLEKGPPKEDEPTHVEDDSTSEAPGQEDSTEEAPSTETKGEPEETDGEDVEFEGLTLRLPKDKAEKFKAERLMHADYTRKTQDVAEQRRTLEADRKAFQQLEQLRGAQFAKAVVLQNLQGQLEQYKQVNWTALAQSDPVKYLEVDRAHRELQEQYTQAQREIQAAQAHEQQLTAQQRQQLIAKGNEALQRDIQGWGPELGQKLMANSKAYGFSDDELAEVYDPRLVKLMHDAYQWRQLQSKPLDKRVTQAKPIKPMAARSSQDSQQAAQIKEASERAKKTGSAKDAEDRLARLFESKRKR